jgi:glycosyltransferase involved in cell wall biosynthesis
MVVLEALSLGVPVVVTDTCHISDLISENCLGVVSQPNPLALSLAAQEVLSQKYLRREIQLRARELFNIDTIVDKFNHAYQRRS